MMVEYLEKLDMYRVDYGGKTYLFDAFSVFEVGPSGVREVEEVPEVLEILRRIFIQSHVENVYEACVTRRRIGGLEVFPFEPPTALTAEKYKVFRNLGDKELVPAGLMEALRGLNVDAVHRLVGGYFVGYLNVGGAGPYAIFDPEKQLYDVYLAVKRYSGEGRVFPVGWWTKLYYRNYTGKASFTVYGELHAQNAEAGVWLLRYYRRKDRNDVRVVHDAFLEVFREFAGVDFNGVVRKLQDARLASINALLEEGLLERVYRGFEEKADVEVFDEVGLPETFRTPVNYVLLKRHGVVAVPAVNLKSRVVDGSLRGYVEIVKKKFKKVL